MTGKERRKSHKTEDGMEQEGWKSGTPQTLEINEWRFYASIPFSHFQPCALLGNYSVFCWKTIGSISNVDLVEGAEKQLDREGDKRRGVGTCQ